MTNSSADEVPFKILLFGALKDAARATQIEVHAPDDSSLSQLFPYIASQFPALEKYLAHVRIAVNCEYSALETKVAACDEIALIPPVAGGCALS